MRRRGPLGYVPWPDGLAAVLSRLHRELPHARVLVAELGYGGTDDHARRAYLRQALEHIAAAQDAGLRIEGVTLWTGIDNYEWLAGFDVPFRPVRRRSSAPAQRPIYSRCDSR